MHLASILDQYQDAFQAKYGARLLPRHLRAIEAIRQCRTPQAGQARAGAAHVHLLDQSAEAIAAFTEAEKSGAEVRVTLAGRIRAVRPMGKLSFAHMEDRAGKVQLFFRANEVGQEKVDFFNRMFDIGDFVQASGMMIRTKTGEVTLQVHEFRMLAKAVSPLPAAKDETLPDGTVVRHAGLEDAELRARQHYADLAINADVREVFRTRAATIRALREFLDQRGFLEVETPILQPLYGGGPPSRSSRITTSWSRICTCASRSSCTSSGCWWATWSARL